MKKPSNPWWDAKQDNVHQDLIQTFNVLKTRQATTMSDMVTALRLYGENLGISVALRDGREHTVTATGKGPILNLVKSCVDASNAQIARNTPRPVFLTDNANRSLQRRAKQLTRFVEGVFEEQNMKEKAGRALFDATMFGTGCLKFSLDADKVCIENVFPGEIFVDPAEAIYKTPQTLYQRKFVHKDVLAAMFPEEKNRIMLAASPIRDFVGYYHQADLSSMVEVVESWKLPTGYTGVEKDGKTNKYDGRHAIVIQNCTLLDEEYNYNDFPFVWTRWTEQRLGFWGRGIPAELFGIQLEINKLVRRISSAIQKLGVPWILQEQNSKVPAPIISNEIAILKYSGVAPTIKTHESFNEQMNRMLQFYWNKGYEQIGVSPYLSAGEKPAGLVSGVGIREAIEVQSGRFAIHVQAFEKLHLDAARWIVRLSKEASEQNPDFSINAPSKSGRYTIETIKWKEVEMEDAQYTLKVYASSALPQEPSGRLSTVIDMMNAGMVDPKEGRKLIDFPDLDAANSLDMAASDAIDDMLEKIVDEGQPLSPEPFFDLQLFIKKAQTLYVRLIANNQAPPKNMRLLRNAIQVAQQMMRAAMEEAQQQQAQQHATAAAGTPLPNGPSGTAPAALQAGDGNVQN